jgi:hypothetical protein
VTTVVTYQQVVDALHAAVAARGEDYVYMPPEGAQIGVCLNWHENVDKPGCIVGYVLHSLGATKEQLKGSNYLGNPNPYAVTAGSTIQALENQHDWILEDRDKIASVLMYVQGLQDMGTPWGEAVRKGIAVTEKYFAQMERTLNDRPA